MLSLKCEIIDVWGNSSRLVNELSPLHLHLARSAVASPGDAKGE